MRTLPTLKPSETVTIDHGPVAKLYHRHGCVCAEDIVMQQVECLAKCLHRMGNDQSPQDHQQIKGSAEQACRIADDLGMVSLSRCLSDLAQVAGRGDDAAIAAIWHRITRIGDQSLIALWELPQLRV